MVRNSARSKNTHQVRNDEEKSAKNALITREIGGKMRRDERELRFPPLIPCWATFVSSQVCVFILCVCVCGMGREGGEGGEGVAAKIGGWRQYIGYNVRNRYM